MHNAVGTIATPVTSPMPRDRVVVLATALAGALLVNLSGQAVVFGLPAIAPGIGTALDDASWLTTAYTMALLAGIVLVSPLIAAFGLRRTTIAAASTFAIAAWVSAAASSLSELIALRAIQGLAAGAFGPVAFVGVFATTGGSSRLPLGLALLAFVLVLPGTVGPALAGPLVSSLGWQGLFLVQGALGTSLGMAAVIGMPRAPIAWAGLRSDWTALILLAVALAGSLLVLTQGGRHGWLGSPPMAWSLAVAVAAWTGFAISSLRAPEPVLSLALLGRGSFVTPITLYLLFRVGLATTAFLIPQLLAQVFGPGSQTVSSLFLWMAMAQLLAFPFTWWLMHHAEGRLIVAAGLVLFGIGVMLAAGSTIADNHHDLRLALAIVGGGQVLFLAPNLLAGARLLTPVDGPTASIVFNAVSVIGTAMGVAIAVEIVASWQAFYAGTWVINPSDVLLPSLRDTLLLFGGFLAAVAAGASVLDPQLPLARNVSAKPAPSAAGARIEAFCAK